MNDTENPEHVSILRDLQEYAERLLSDDALWQAHEARIAEIEAHERQEKADKLAATRKRRWEEIPATYREPFDRTKCKLKPEVINQIARWKPIDGMGMGIAGSSGLGKTRVLVRLLQNLGGSYKFINATSLADAVRNQYNHDWAVAARAESVVSECEKCRVLLLDDVGMESPTEAVAEAFLALIEHRTANKLPTLWTSNLSDAQLEHRYKTRGQGFIRRLKQFSLMI